LQLGGPTALLKAQSTKTFEFCAREAAQIFGGASYVRGGQGEKVRVTRVAPCEPLLTRLLLQVERLYREVRAYAIPGGSGSSLFCLYLVVACVCLRVFASRRGDHDRSGGPSGDEGRQAGKAVSADCGATRPCWQEMSVKQHACMLFNARLR